ncbi:magnesium transporter [Haloplasma contractile]|uniref:Magnesium transporter MgtE n=1 Tax=Haloplasma contractile SSD-17B TaxID=1033810 RepID=U2E8S6_9MOLU|nr:magnesium transporter [Haloplasma contractile]ERJ11543.1 IMP dehydrogenase protein [Haloplasma contractile SSD-17B]
MNERSERTYELTAHLEIKDVLKEENFEIFREELLSFHPFDLAAAFIELDDPERYKVYNSLSPIELAKIFEHLDFELVPLYFEEMNTFYVASLLEAMNIDDCVDILNNIEEKKVLASYLSIMNKEIVKEIRGLLQYEEETAGSIMTTDFIEIPINLDVKQAMKKLVEDAVDAETIYTLYIVDENRKLMGIMSLRELILARAHETIGDLMNQKVVSVLASLDQEEVAHIMRDYDFLSVPVVDYQDHMLGIITIDDIVDVIDEEANEDYEKFAGVSDIEDLFESNPFKSAKQRLPWLIALLFLGMVISTLLNFFGDTLEAMVDLAFFIPVIAGMAGNTGTQSLAITIRGLASDDIESIKKLKYIMKEAVTGLIIGLVTSVIAFGLVMILKQDPVLALLVAIAILGSLIVANLAGTVTPLVMVKLNVDPAIASGPFIQTLNDLISNSIYLGLATWILNTYL